MLRIWKVREPIFLSTAKARGVLKAPPQKYIFATRELFEGWPLSDMEIVVDRRGKPAPDPYLAAAELIGVDPGDCVAIEDSPTGVASALASGCRTVAVPHVVAVVEQPGLVIRETLAGVGLADLF